MKPKLGIPIKKSAQALPEQLQKIFEKQGKGLLTPKMVKNEVSKK